MLTQLVRRYSPTRCRIIRCWRQILEPQNMLSGCLLRRASDYSVLKKFFQYEKHALWTMIRRLVRLYLKTRVGSSGPKEVFNWILNPVRISLVLLGQIVRRMGGRGSSDNPVLLCFSDFLFSDLDLIGSSILSSSKCFSEFHSLSWAELEQVCMNFKANSTMVKLLTQESLL
jgi:hypothetical protein